MLTKLKTIVATILVALLILAGICAIPILIGAALVFLFWMAVVGVILVVIFVAYMIVTDS